MRTAITFLPSAAAAAAFILSGVNAIALLQRSQGPARVVEGTLQRRQIDDLFEHDRKRLQKRKSNTLSVGLENAAALYYMNVSIGTPAQNFRLHLDTGSSDLWVNAGRNDLCSGQSTECSISGTYNANESSTYTYLDSAFTVSYIDGSGSTGDYATDLLAFDNVKLENQQFGIGYTSSSYQGVLGIGYPANEVSVTKGRRQPYPNLPQNLMLNGYIASNAYSLWLNDLDASTGSIIFGGVNSAKYTGSLETLPIIKEGDTYAEFIIALTAVGQNGNTGSFAANLASPVLLDSGSSLMYLPDDVTNSIFQAVNAKYDSSQGVASVNCDLAHSDDTIDFTFSSPTIRIGMDELVIQTGFDHDHPTCILGVTYAGDTTPVLGDTFLRSAYVVYDLGNNEISIAQTRFNSTSNHILEITNSSNVPDATAVANPVTSLAVQPGGARIRTGDFTTVSQDAALPGVTPAPAWNLALLGVVGAAAIIGL